MSDALLDYVEAETHSGRRVGVFSCEDPLNTRFHRDLLALSDYIQLKTSIGAEVDLASVELGATLRGIDSWLVVGHTDGLQVCGAIFMATQESAPSGYLGERVLGIRNAYRLESTLEANVRDWTCYQAARLEEHLASLRAVSPGLAVQARVRAGLIRYVGNLYVSELLS